MSSATSARRPPLLWRRRLEARLLLGVGVITALLLVTVLFATSRFISVDSAERSRRDLQAARAAFGYVVAGRTRFAAAQTRLIAALPVFRAHMTDARVAADTATLYEMAEGYRQDLAADGIVVTDAAGEWLVRAGWSGDAVGPESFEVGVEAATAGRAHSEIVVVRDRLYLVVSEPAMFGTEVLGGVVAGYALDDAVAREIARVTNCEVNLVAGARVVASSLPDEERVALEALLGNPTRSTDPAVPAVEQRLGRSHYLQGVFPFLESRAEASLVLLRDLQPTRQAVAETRARLLWLGGAVFLVGVAGSLCFGRAATRPLRELALVAPEIAAGRWDRRLPVGGTAEAAEMAIAFNEMTVNLSHWHAEAEARAARLRASRDRFLSVTDSANDGIISADGRGRISFWNRRAEAMFGYSSADVVGQPITLVLGGDEQTGIGGDLSAGGETPVGRTVELEGRRRDGTSLPIELSLAVCQAGGDVSYTCIVRDISERQRLEEQVRGAQRLEAVGRLAGGIAHDFNNMLSVIRGYAGFLTKRFPDGDVRDDLDAITTAADRSAVLIKQLLAFSRQQPLRLEVFDINQVIRSLDKLLRPVIGEDIELTCHVPDGALRVEADRGQIDQILMNLAMNARDAMPTGGALAIEAEAVELGAHVGVAPGAYVTISVSDTGTGIDKETQGKIFEPFFTTKGPGGGTGLGLSTVYGIARQAGGAVLVYSEPGHGTSLKVYLPRVPDTASSGASHEPKAVDTLSGQELILLVEDEALVRSVARRTLAAAGYAVLEADGPLAAIRVWEERGDAIDLLLTDVVMPGMNGRELADHVTRLGSSPRVLFMSGYADRAVANFGVLQDETVFLQKPFSDVGLLSTVRRVLDAAPRVARSASAPPGARDDAGGQNAQPG